MKPRPPTDADYELADRFFYPVLGVIEDELARGTNNMQVALILNFFAIWAARQDPVMARTTLTLLAKDMQNAADEVLL